MRIWILGSKTLSCALALVLMLSAFPPSIALSDPLRGLSIVFPILGPRLSSNYGNRKHPVARYVRHHNGVDLAAPENSHVRAVMEGTVVFADKYAGYGKLVTIQHANGYVSLYGHLSDIKATPGKKVAAGDIVGLVGSTGLATGPHLHFEWRKNGKSIDPLTVFPTLAAAAEG